MTLPLDFGRLGSFLGPQLCVTDPFQMLLVSAGDQVMASYGDVSTFVVTATSQDLPIPGVSMSLVVQRSSDGPRSLCTPGAEAPWDSGCGVGLCVV